MHVGFLLGELLVSQKANWELDAAGYVGYFCLAAGVNLACNVEAGPLLNIACSYCRRIIYLQHSNPFRTGMLSSPCQWQSPGTSPCISSENWVFRHMDTWRSTA